MENPSRGESFKGQPETCVIPSKGLGEIGSMELRYAVLFYAVSIIDDAGSDVAMVTMAIDVDGSTRPLTLTTAPNWRALVGKEDVEYIGEVFGDLQRVGQDERLEAFQRLSEMSAGRLRTRIAGQCSEAELGTVLRGSLLAQAS